MNSTLFLILESIAVVLSLIVLPGTILLAVISVCGLKPISMTSKTPAQGRMLILVPAHNEQLSIATTVANLQQECARDMHSEVLVIADNCDDETALYALSAGAQVIQRSDLDRRGKGYALDYAFQRLLKDPNYADVLFFVVVDADSQVNPGFLHALRQHFAHGAVAVQAHYTVLNEDSSIRTSLMQIALSAFNVLRPRGRAALGCSAGILGNGFALRREILENIPYTAGSLVEDIEYHLILVWHGVRVQFAESAILRGEMPAKSSTAKSQRARWEGGRLRLLIDHAPSLAKDVLRGHKNALEPLFDLLLLPLSFHLLLLGILAILPFVWTQVLAVTGLSVLIVHVLAAAYVGKLQGKHLLALLYVPFYVMWKLCQIPAILASSQRNAPWLRSVRMEKNGMESPTKTSSNLDLTKHHQQEKAKP